MNRKLIQIVSTILSATFRSKRPISPNTKLLLLIIALILMLLASLACSYSGSVSSTAGRFAGGL